jgi:hypothetical protein
MDDQQKLAALGPERMPDFCVKLDFPKGTRNPQRLLKSAAAYIEALTSLDSLLVSSIDAQIKPVFILEEVEAGSIRLWLKQILEEINDNALENMDWKPAVGKYLVKAKYRLLSHLEGKKSLPPKNDIEAIAAEISRAAQETGVRRLPAYRAIDAVSLANKAREISESLKPLEEGDTISFESDEGTALLSPEFVVTQEDITELFAGRSIANDLQRILMVRRPDFLGDARWEFRYERKPFSARIGDEAWLHEFHTGKIDIRPGDALRVMLREMVTYDQGGEVMKEEREILQVLEVIKPAIQMALPISE